MRVVEAIKKNTPDDIHMSQRYATLLDILVNAVLRTSKTTVARSNGSDMDVDSHFSPYSLVSSLFESDQLDLGDDWIYDSNFWDTLPDMAGLNTVPNLIFPLSE
ncbi:hypothetical protein BDW62DRAFT_203870 [Aspergillus aurantiobrunneus]